MSADQPSSFRLVASLTVAGLIAGLALVGIYLGTKDRIEFNQAEMLKSAIYVVLPGTVEIVPMEISNGTLGRGDGKVKVPKRGEDIVFAGFDDKGKPVGYAVPGEGPGFMDNIRLLYGFEPKKKEIVGLQVLEHRETPGLGDRIKKDKDFQKNFTALAVQPVIVGVKKGKKVKPNEVDCITGATISSKSVIKILNKSSKKWLNHLTPQNISKAGEGR